MRMPRRPAPMSLQRQLASAGRYRSRDTPQEQAAYALRQRCTVYDAVVKDTRCEADASSNAGGLLANVAD